MARRRRRSYRSYVQVPGIGDLPFMGRSVNSTDVLVGAAAGVIGSGAVKFILGKLPFQLPAQLAPVMPLLTAGAAGAALYYGQKKSGRGTAHMVGAVAAGVAISAMDLLKTNLPQYFGDVVSLQLSNYGRGYGLLVDEAQARMGGLIVDDNSSRSMSDANLADLAAASMGDNDGEAEDLMELDY